VGFCRNFGSILSAQHFNPKFLAIEGKDEFETARLDELNELLNEVQQALGKYPGVAMGFAQGDRVCS
jgi:hypothetical protein